jgi:hypothetical protein
MSRPVTRIGMVVAVALAASSLPATAEVTSIAGYTLAEVTEFRSGVEGDHDRATDSYPETSAVLPLQVIAHLTSSGFLAGTATEEAAAIVAAQFADPRLPDSPNPGEFAINLALNSVSESIRYEARAVSRETRSVVHLPRELDLLVPAGAPVSLTGRLFLDGALTLFAEDAGQDFTGAYATLTVTVVKRLEGLPDETLFTGRIELRGDTEGQVTVADEGAFPTDRLILDDLTESMPDFGAFHVLIIPDIAIDYPYSANLGQEFILEATVEMTAANLPDHCGVAAVLGTSTDALTQVIELTEGAEVAAETLSAFSKAREDAAADAALQPPSLFPLCGVLGFETLIGLAALVGIRNFASPRRYSRK